MSILGDVIRDAVAALVDIRHRDAEDPDVQLQALYRIERSIADAKMRLKLQKQGGSP